MMDVHTQLCTLRMPTTFLLVQHTGHKPRPHRCRHSATTPLPSPLVLEPHIALAQEPLPGSKCATQMQLARLHAARLSA